MPNPFRTLTTILSVFILAAGSSRGEEPGEQLSKEAALLVKQSTAYVKGKTGHGSGFVVRPNAIATNAHVVKNELPEDMSVQFVNAKGEVPKYKVQLLYKDGIRDLAFLRVVEPLVERPPLKVAPNFDPSTKPAVFVVGNPAQAIRGVSLVNSIGRVRCEGVPAMIRDQPYLQLIHQMPEKDPKDQNNLLDPDRQVGPGNSGGPVVDRNGTVIGILTAGIMTKVGGAGGEVVPIPTENFYAVPCAAVNVALEKLGPPEKWDDRIRKATAQHVLDLAMTNTYVHGRVTELFFISRINPASNISRDKELVAAFKEIDKELAEQGEAMLKAAKKNPDLTQLQWQKLHGFRDSLDLLRRITQKNWFGPADMRQGKDTVAKCREYYEKFCNENGLSDRPAEERLKKILPR
jgi:hypothetical protein